MTYEKSPEVCFRATKGKNHEKNELSHYNNIIDATCFHASSCLFMKLCKAL